MSLLDVFLRFVLLLVFSSQGIARNDLLFLDIDHQVFLFITGVVPKILSCTVTPSNLLNVAFCRQQSII